jgi:hypothetical protein
VRLHIALALPLKEQQAPVQKELPHFKAGLEVHVPLQASSVTRSVQAVAVQQEPSTKALAPVR